MGFIEKYARAEASENEMEHNDDAGGDEVITDDKTNFQDQEPTNLRLMNVTRYLQDAVADGSMAFDLDLIAVDPENFVSDFDDEVSYEFDEFLGFEKQIHKFDEELKIFEKEAKDSFYFSVLPSTIIYSRKRKILISVKTKKDCAKFWGKRFKKNSSSKSTLQLDLSFSTFETQCHMVKNLSNSTTNYCDATFLQD